MLKCVKLLAFCGLFVSGARAQESETIFGSNALKNSGGYAAISNKFTTINGDFANMPELYGGWFVNHRFLIGIEMAATTNRIPVPPANQTIHSSNTSYQYGQFGLMTEYSIASRKRLHVNLNLVTGSGFILQYERDPYDWHYEDYEHDAHFFFVMEPGIQIEANLFKWMRFSPGISYRRVFGSQARGLGDDDLSGLSGNLTLKFGRF